MAGTRLGHDGSDFMVDDRKKAHTLADHALGEGLDHVHGDDTDHDHDHDHDFAGDGPAEENPLWVHDHVALTSVGIDIGSAGTQVMFSRLNLRRMGEELSSRYFVVARETLFQSDVALTPYRDDGIAQPSRGAIVAPSCGAGVARADSRDP